MPIIPDWNYEDIEVAYSKGGVMAFSDYKRNLIRTGIPVWPPAAIVQKLYNSRHAYAYRDEAFGIVTRHLGYFTMNPLPRSFASATSGSLYGQCLGRKIDLQPIVLQHPRANQDFVTVNKGRSHTNPVAVKTEIDEKDIFLDGSIGCQKGCDTAYELRVHLKS